MVGHAEGALDVHHAAGKVLIVLLEVVEEGNTQLKNEDKVNLIPFLLLLSKCFFRTHVSKPRTRRAQIQSDLVESYGFFTNQLIMSKVSTHVHYSKKEVCLYKK